MDYFVRQIGVHRGAPRIYLDTDALRHIGFEPGARFRITNVGDRLELKLDDEGDRVVARKRRGQRELPVIDINNREVLKPFLGHVAVRIALVGRTLHILAVASLRRAMARERRLLSKLRAGQPLSTASLSFGAGMATWALHEGLLPRIARCEQQGEDRRLDRHGDHRLTSPAHQLLGADAPRQPLQRGHQAPKAWSGYFACHQPARDDPNVPAGAVDLLRFFFWRLT